jgi:cell division protein FtsQ
LVDLRPRSDARKRTGRSKPAGAQAGLWHRPALLNVISDMLLLGAAAVLGYALVVWVAHRPTFQLREVVVLTPPAQVSTEQLEYAARSAVTGNFFTVDLDQVRDAFEKLPWVRRAQVRRHWPDALELRLEEHQAVAYWTVTGTGDTRLVNRQGEVFVAASNARMPVFSGPEGYAPYLLAEYGRFAEALAPLGHDLVAVGLSAREAWQLTLEDGLVIRLGRDHKDAPAEARLARFVSAYPKALAQRPLQVAIADLRYPNGFALLPKDGGHTLENKK